MVVVHLQVVVVQQVVVVLQWPVDVLEWCVVNWPSFLLQWLVVVVGTSASCFVVVYQSVPEVHLKWKLL